MDGEGDQVCGECDAAGFAWIFGFNRGGRDQAWIQEYEMEDANQALAEMKQGKIRGAKVLQIWQPKKTLNEMNHGICASSRALQISQTNACWR